MAGDEAIIQITSTHDGVQVSWPLSVDEHLVKPQVAIAPDAAGAVLLRLRPVRGWTFRARAVVLPVDPATADWFRLLNALSTLPQAAYIVVGFVVAGGNSTARLMFPGWGGAEAIGVFVACALVSALSAVMFAIHQAVPQYPHVGPDRRVVVAHVSPAFVDELISANPAFARQVAPVKDAFADRYAAAG